MMVRVSDMQEPLRVWIVAEEDRYREALRDLVDHEPDLLCARAFDTHAQALSHLTERTAPDVLLLDIDSFRTDGPQTAQQVRLCSSVTKILALSGGDDGDRILRVLCAGARGCFSKGIPSVKIVEAVRNVVGRAGNPRWCIARRLLALFAPS